MKTKWWLIALLVCGFIDVGQEAPYQIIADYVFPGIGNEVLATILAGWIGTLILFGMAYGVAWLLKSRKREPVK